MVSKYGKSAAGAIVVEPRDPDAKLTFLALCFAWWWFRRRHTSSRREKARYTGMEMRGTGGRWWSGSPFPCLGSVFGSTTGTGEFFFKCRRQSRRGEASWDGRVVSVCWPRVTLL